MRQGFRIALCCGLLLAACRSPEAWPPLPPGDPRPGELLADWAAQLGARQSMRARARLAVDAEDPTGREIRLRARQRMWVARPARMRVEIQGLLGTTLAVLTIDGHEYALLEAEARAFESGPVRDTLLWEVARLDLTPEQAVDVILGAPELGRDLRVRDAFALPDGRVRIALAEGRGPVARVADFDAQGRLLRLEVRDSGGRVLYEVTYDAYAELDGVPVAHDLTIQAAETLAVLSLQGIELDPPLDDAAFRLAPPGEAGDASRPAMP